MNSSHTLDHPCTTCSLFCLNTVHTKKNKVGANHTVRNAQLARQSQHLICSQGGTSSSTIALNTSSVTYGAHSFCHLSKKSSGKGVVVVIDVASRTGMSILHDRASLGIGAFLVAGEKRSQKKKQKSNYLWRTTGTLGLGEGVFSGGLNAGTHNTFIPKRNAFQWCDAGVSSMNKCTTVAWLLISKRLLCLMMANINNNFCYVRAAGAIVILCVIADIVFRCHQRPHC